MMCLLQVGSYFGSVLCPLDVNKDGETDVLLVGAPMFMSAEKKEMGKVYVFSITKVSKSPVQSVSAQLIYDGSLKPPRS